MAYRNDIEALEARHRALESDLVDRVRERDDVAHMLAEARAREREDQVRIDAALRGPERRRRWAIVAAAILLLITIAGVMTYRKASRRPRSMSDVIARFEMFADDACGCRDIACTQRTVDAMMAWSAVLARERPMTLPVDDNTTQYLQQVAEQFTRCVTRLATDPQVESQEPAEPPQ